MASDDEDEYVFFGTPLQEEEESRAGQRRKDVKDPALTKQLPLHKQVQHLCSRYVLCIIEIGCMNRLQQHFTRSNEFNAGGNRCRGQEALPWCLHWRVQRWLLQHRGLTGGMGTLNLQILPRGPRLRQVFLLSAVLCHAHIPGIPIHAHSPCMAQHVPAYSAGRIVRQRLCQLWKNSIG